MIYPKKCPCCGDGMIEEVHAVCPVCGWEDDRVQNEDPDFAGGANRESLNEYRRRFQEERMSEEETGE